jgi:hypothetical protein
MPRLLPVTLALALAVALAFVACSPPPPRYVEGGHCQGEGTGACHEAEPLALICTNGTWAAFSECRGANGCVVDGGELSCDTSGNSVGDHCAPTSEGKVRCDPDGGLNILRCVSGVLGVEFVCPPPTLCIFDTDGGVLTCR